MNERIPARLRQLVRQRARGCCEYCLFPESTTLAPHEVGHIVARKHGGVTEEDNLALCCTLCGG
jgi:5-methylcytosine-specific restriction endonuclease McrA